MDRRTFLAACSGLTTFAMASRAGEPSQGDIQRLVEQLGSRKFTERERASKALREMDKAALPALRRAAKQHTDAEVRRRAQALISKFIDGVVRREFARLRGTWRVVRVTADGELRPATDPGGRWEFDGNVVSWLVSKGEDNAFRCHLDPTATPKVMDCVLLSDPTGAPVLPGIYSLDGDLLRVCCASPGQPRPSEFVSTKNSNRLLLLLKRVRRAQHDLSRGHAEAR